MDIPETDQSAHAPMIAAPAAVGYGPTVAMPTLVGMMPEMKDFEEDETDGNEDGLDLSSAGGGVRLRVKSPGVSPRHSEEIIFETVGGTVNCTIPGNVYVRCGTPLY